MINNMNHNLKTPNSLALVASIKNIYVNDKILSSFFCLMLIGEFFHWSASVGLHAFSELDG